MEIIDEKMDRIRNRKPHNPSKALAFGLLIVFFGIALLLRNMGLLDQTTRHVIFSWQMLLIAIGAINLFDRGRTFGIVLIAIGVFFMSADLFVLPVSLHHIFWPSILILLGIYLITGRRHKYWRTRFPDSNLSGEDYIDQVAIFGGGEKFVSSQSFKGGKITAIFGGADVNFMNAKLAEGTQILEVACIFGGANLIFPANWNVVVEVTPILGGVDDKGFKGEVDNSRTLIIKGAVIFGGCDIKRF